jgi:hypothetical protein
MNVEQLDARDVTMWAAGSASALLGVAFVAGGF